MSSRALIRDTHKKHRPHSVALDDIRGLTITKELGGGSDVDEYVIEAEEDVEGKACGRHCPAEVRFVILTSLTRLLSLWLLCTVLFAGDPCRPHIDGVSVSSA